jgi:hypothetical protein
MGRYYTPKGFDFPHEVKVQFSEVLPGREVRQSR